MIFKYFACRVIIIVLSFAFLLTFSRLIWNAFQIETAYYLWNFGCVQIQKISTFAISFSTDNTQKFFFLIYSTSEKVSHWKIDFVQKFLLFKVLSYLVKNYGQKKNNLIKHFDPNCISLLKWPTWCANFNAATWDTNYKIHMLLFHSWCNWKLFQHLTS